FLNRNDAKHSVTARYLYEHIYLGHINFFKDSKEFFELVRSYTPSPQPIKIIPTLRVFDDPKVKKFYYRFRKVHSTLVHKTHIVLTLDEDQYQEIEKLFIKKRWVEPPHKLDYEVKRSSNPFINFYQIPVESRYRFLLNNAHFIITTFIRGPVCRGQMAVNAIEDHFWVMFLDPKYDLSVKYNSFLLLQAQNLEMPIESISQRILETFSDAYREKYKRYFFAKERFYDKEFPQGMGIDAIWAGERSSDAPILTVYRHFNSASVHRGVLGALPKTAWVMDYPQFERLYYTLVAGYDVFGNVAHQTNIRRYMDFLRMEGEINFVSFLPPSVRYSTLQSWYIGDDAFKKNIDNILVRDTKVKYKTKHYKKEFIEKVITKRIQPKTAIDFDKLNYNTLHVKMPKEFQTQEDVDKGISALDKKHIAFIQYMNDFGTNNALMRIKLHDGSYIVRSIVVNRWHNNVNSLFLEKYQLDPKKDTIDIVKGSIGSYPNMFVSVDIKDLKEFFDLIENFDGSDVMQEQMKRFLLSRDDKEFWKTYDWFQAWFDKSEPIKSGLYDLNRYYKYPF
ncbi:MAG: peptidylprolyl isomerase, partial [Epsilonproteobacteria bacterium]|nr:peptidylprolyl isomerase [Campylobacterota bacterium]